MRKVKDLLIIGAGDGDIIKLIDDINANNLEWNVIGFADMNKSLKGKMKFGYPVLGTEEEVLPKYPEALVTLNVSRTPLVRMKAIGKIKRFTDKFATLIHPSVNIKFSKIGKGVVIHEGVILGYNVLISDYVHIHFNSTIGHDTSIGKYSIINPGAVISGRVIIEEGVLVGAGSRIIQEVKIGSWSVVGIGSVVFRSVKSKVIYISNIKKVLIPNKEVPENEQDSTNRERAY